MDKAIKTEIRYLTKSMGEYRGQYGLDTEQCIHSSYTVFLAMEDKPVNRQTNTMIPRKLQWKYIGRTNTHWIAMLPGEYPPIRFALERLSDETYLIKCDLNGVKNCSCEGLKRAKQQAQELFNSYAISLFDSPIAGGISSHKTNNI